MPKFSGIDASLIAAFSGRSFVESQGGGGGASTFTTSSTGLLLWGGLTAPSGPVSGDALLSPSTPPSSYQLSEHTDITELHVGRYGIAYIRENGDLYTMYSPNVTSYAGAVGRSIDTIGTGEFGLAATGMSKVAVHTDSILAISQSGELVYAGYGRYAGAGTTYSNYQFTKVGSDTDWVDFIVEDNHDTTSRLAIKGSAGSREIYAIGSNSYGVTGQNTTSGILTSWTKLKQSNSTDWDVSGEWVKGTMGLRTAAAILDGGGGSGSLYVWGDGNYGTFGLGTSTDYNYPVQVDSGGDQDWQSIHSQYGGYGVRGGEMYISSYTNFGWPWSYSAGVSLNRNYQKVTTGDNGLMEDWYGAGPSQLLQTYLYLCRYNSKWYIYGSQPSSRGDYNYPSTSTIANFNSTTVPNTYFTSISNLVAGTISEAENTTSNIPICRVCVQNDSGTGAFIIMVKKS